MCSAEELRILRGEQEVNENNLRLDLSDDEDESGGDDLSERSLDQEPRAGGGTMGRPEQAGKGTLRGGGGAGGDFASTMRPPLGPAQVRWLEGAAMVGEVTGAACCCRGKTRGALQTAMCLQAWWGVRAAGDLAGACGAAARPAGA